MIYIYEYIRIEKNCKFKKKTNPVRFIGSGVFVVKPSFFKGPIPWFHGFMSFELLD